ncbi:MAG: redoxin domain-containing protein [bacterium]
MEAYRDQYAKLFNNGKNVIVLGVSVDADTTLASWARDQQTPVLYASDIGQKVGKQYGAISGAMDDRSLFVIDPTGKIVKRMQPFNVLSQQSYEDLEAAVKETLPKP